MDSKRFSPNYAERARKLAGRWSELCSLHLPIAPEGSMWRYSGGPRADEPEQGWKLHVSATTLNAHQVLDKIAPALMTSQNGSGANLIIMDNRGHNPSLFREARTLQRPSFQSSSYHSGRAMVCHLLATQSRVNHCEDCARRTSPTVPPTVFYRHE